VLFLMRILSWISCSGTNQRLPPLLNSADPITYHPAATFAIFPPPVPAPDRRLPLDLPRQERLPHRRYIVPRPVVSISGGQDCWRGMVAARRAMVHATSLYTHPVHYTLTIHSLFTHYTLYPTIHHTLTTGTCNKG
jgi:hypothetical protein